jgi:hypothetical protein
MMLLLLLLLNLALLWLGDGYNSLSTECEMRYSGSEVAQWSPSSPMTEDSSWIEYSLNLEIRYLDKNLDK